MFGFTAADFESAFSTIKRHRHCPACDVYWVSETDFTCWNCGGGSRGGTPNGRGKCLSSSAPASFTRER